MALASRSREEPKILLAVLQKLREPGTGPVKLPFRCPDRPFHHFGDLVMPVPLNIGHYNSSISISNERAPGARTPG